MRDAHPINQMRRIFRVRGVRYAYLFGLGAGGLTATGMAYASLGWSPSLAFLHAASLAATILGGIVSGWEMHKDPLTRVVFEKDERK